VLAYFEKLFQIVKLIFNISHSILESLLKG
jgi:hypothetical protein